MKIALLFDGISIPPKDGVTYRVYHIIKSLFARGADIKLYLGDRNFVSDQKLVEDGIDCTLFPADWLYDENLEKVADLIKKDKPDIIHVCNSHTVVLNFGRHLADLLKVKLVCDMHDVDAHLFKTLGKSREEIQRATLMQLLVAKCSDRIICMSSLDREQLLGMGVEKEKLVYIPNGVDVIDEVPRRMNNKKILFVGNLYYLPNQSAAIRIIEEIAPKVLIEEPDAEFIIVGRAPEELIAKSTRNVRIVGESDNLDDYLMSASVGIAPLIEGSGMKVKVLTYSSWGLPVIGSETAYMGYSDTECFLHAESSEEFINQILWVLRNYEQASDLGMKGYLMVKNVFSWEKLIDKLLSTYSELFTDKNINESIMIDENNDNTIPEVLNSKKLPLPFWLSEKRFVGKSNEDVLCRKIEQGKIVNI